MMDFLHKYETFFIGTLIFLTVVIAGYRLAESPPVWFDEGVFLQVAENLAQGRGSVIQTAPDKFVSASNIASVGYPLLYPVAASLRYFGDGILPARTPMVFWIVLLVLSAYFLIRGLFGHESALWSSLLLVSFAPLYGNGKSVLGEVPGLALLLLFCLFFHKALRDKSAYYFVLAGLMAGLCVATKPLFILILPAIIGGWLISLYMGFARPTIGEAAVFFIAMLAPVAFWIFSGFSEDSSATAVLSWYLNPYGILNMREVALGNLFRLVTESTPIYFAVAAVIWFTTIVSRRRAKDTDGAPRVSFVEFILAIFALLVGIFYLRTPGWYRYFFPGHVVALLFLPPTLFWLTKRYANKILKNYASLGISVLRLTLSVVIAFQFYQVGFASFTARSYDSHNSLELAKYFSELPAEQTVFLYQVPEVAIFVSDKGGFYQYLSPRSGQILGDENLKFLRDGAINKIVTRSELVKDLRRQFPIYEKSYRIGHYVVLE